MATDTATAASPYADRMDSLASVPGDADNGLVDFFLWQSFSDYASDAPKYHPDSPLKAAALFELLPKDYQRNALIRQKGNWRYLSEDATKNLYDGKAQLDKAGMPSRIIATFQALHVIWYAIIILVVVVLAIYFGKKEIDRERANKPAIKKGFLDWGGLSMSGLTSSFL